MKKCSECKIVKDNSLFFKDSRTKSGLYSACKSCHRKHIVHYLHNNKEKMKRYYRDWQRNFLRSSVQARINIGISKRIAECLKGNKAGRHWEDLVGYTITDLMNHIESKFTTEMNWENRGTYWELDHIKPKSLFKYSSPADKEFKECWALNNLQPLEKSANRKKSAKFTNI